MADTREALEIVREDDFVEYFIFPDIGLDQEEKDIKHCLSQLLTLIETIVSNYGSSYIWQKDIIRFTARYNCEKLQVNNTEEKIPAHLYGVTHYGENIEDEWFIVYLLMKATAEIPGIVVRIIDSDGEFILIEAAEQLPKWATPETCEKRVYLYNGAIHLIDSDRQSQMNVHSAVDTIRSRPETTVASAAMQDAVSARITGYPQRIVENHHSCNVYVPVGVAALLKARPSLVAAAVTAFCHRDPLDIKACRAMRFFPPEQCVLTRVVFTKCLYAMLTHQKYVPDRRTGWNLPPVTDPAYAANLLGVKLACGFEILVSQSKSCGQTDELSKDWQRYKTALANKGYFKDLLEGSQEYVRLEQEAQEYFQNHCIQSQPPTGQLIFDLLQNLDVDADELRSSSNSLPPSDDDSWLEINQSELDQMLEQRYGCKPSYHSSDISAKLANFLNHVSTVDGAEFPQDGEAPPVRPPRGIKLKKTTPVSEKDDDDNKVTFDQEAFSCAIQNILDFVVPEDNWDMESEGSGMSSYEDEGDMDLGQKSGQQTDTPISELKQYMDQMDQELSSTAVGKSFEKKQASPNNKGMEDSFSEVEHFEPVDIDMNALKNILESYQAQLGDAGPASNLLGPMGVRLDQQ